MLDFFSWLKFQLYLFKVLSKEKFVSVHINDMQALIYSIMQLWLRGKRIFFNLRGVFSKDKEYGIQWKLVNYCSKIIVLSNEMKTELMERLPLSKRNRTSDFIQYIYSIVNSARFNPSEQTQKTPPYNLLVSAAFNDLKNQLVFLEQTRQWIANRNIKIHFLGDDNNSYGFVCKSLVAKYNISEKVVFHGYRQEIEHFYKEAYITLVASRREGLARNMIESLACGVPVVSFDVCSAKEILEGHSCGTVVKQGDYASLLDAIDELMNSKNLRKQYSENGIRAAKKLFNAQSNIKEYEKIYHSI